LIEEILSIEIHKGVTKENKWRLIEEGSLYARQATGKWKKGNQKNPAWISPMPYPRRDLADWKAF
jgi:hypothetical protein